MEKWYSFLVVLITSAIISETNISHHIYFLSLYQMDIYLLGLCL